ncbi:MAG: hypothetical protein V4490_05120 [Pseudomonadota bacterium]
MLREQNGSEGSQYQQATSAPLQPNPQPLQQQDDFYNLYDDYEGSSAEEEETDSNSEELAEYQPESSDIPAGFEGVGRIAKRKRAADDGENSEEDAESRDSDAAYWARLLEESENCPPPGRVVAKKRAVVEDMYTPLTSGHALAPFRQGTDGKIVYAVVQVLVCTQKELRFTVCPSKQLSQSDMEAGALLYPEWFINLQGRRTISKGDIGAEKFVLPSPATWSEKDKPFWMICHNWSQYLIATMMLSWPNQSFTASQEQSLGRMLVLNTLGYAELPWAPLADEINAKHRHLIKQMIPEVIKAQCDPLWRLVPKLCEQLKPAQRTSSVSDSMMHTDKQETVDTAPVRTVSPLRW